MNGSKRMGTKDKDYLKKFWSFQEVDRIPFLPLLGSLPAKIVGISVETMLTNPTKMALALQKTQKLFNYDGIFNIADATLEAEACGCQLIWSGESAMPSVVSHLPQESKVIDEATVPDLEANGRIPVVLEATKRLQAILGHKMDVIATVTGPLSLSRLLAGESFMEDVENDFSRVFPVLRYANTIALRLCKLYAESKLDGILIWDPLISTLNVETVTLLKPFYRTLYNVVSFFNMYLIVSVGSISADVSETVFGLDANGFIISGTEDIDHLLDLSANMRKHLGYGISKTTLLGHKDRLSEAVPDVFLSMKRGCFLTTDGPLSYETPVENIHELVKRLRTG